MKKILTIISIIALSLSFTACDAIFDNLEGDKSKLSGEYLAESEAGLSRMMASLYSSIPMGAFSEGDKSTDNAVDSHGTAISNSSPNFWNYTTMRSANQLIKIVEKSYENGKINETLRDLYIAEARFVRAYYYFGMVKQYGGVPIVTEPLDDEYNGTDNAGLYIPRSTEKETWDFVLSELTEVAKALPAKREDGIYRANKWSALGLKARVALYAASVSKYWDKAPITACDPVTQKLTYMEASYANEYYSQCIAACEEIINSGVFSLYNPTPSSVDAAVAGLTELFMTRQDCEWIFGRSYNSGEVGASNGIDWKNSPNQARFTGATGVWRFACYNANADLADLYDDYTASFGRADGTIKTRVDGNETNWVPSVYTTPENAASIDYIKYDNLADPFKNKDARFQAWVIYPGTQFRGTDIVIQGGLWGDNLQICGAVGDKVTLNGTDYYMFGNADETRFSGFHGRGRTNDGSWYTTGFGLRKYLENKEPIQYSLNPWYDIRYTEILLAYCEAIVERDGANAGKSKEYLNAIRRRAYFQDEIDATLENVLKERRCELMFEDDRAMTLHRRRDFYRPGENLDEMRRHAIIPVLDIRDGKPQYIFVRAYMWTDDLDALPKAYEMQPKNYYGSIPNWEKNKITRNPNQLI